MTINLSVRNFVLTIGGLDCSKTCVSFVGADEQIEPTRGLISFTGTIELHRPVGFESLDDRRNNRWARGVAITLTIADTAGTLRPPPRGGALFILESEYNLETRRLRLKIGDAFALYQNNQPKGDASKICLGSNTAKIDVINNLLRAACISLILPPDTVPGFLSAPTARAIEGSYLEQAGAIAASEGYFLYKDSLGVTRAKAVPIAPYPTLAAVTIALVNDVAIYNRVYGKQPAQRMIVTGRATIVEPTGDTFTETTIEFGPAAMLGGPKQGDNGDNGSGTTVYPEIITADGAGPVNTTQIIIRIKTIVDKYSKSGKRRDITTHIQEPAGLAMPQIYPGNGSLINTGSQTETYRYEIDAPISGTDGTDPCQRGNMGRLKTYYRHLRQPEGMVFAEIFAVKDSTIGAENLTMAEEELITYNYNFRRTVSTFGLSNEENETTLPSDIRPTLAPGLKHERKLWRPAGAIAPSAFIDKTEAGPNDPPEVRFGLDPKTRRLAELKRDEWFEQSPKNWEYRQVEWKSLATAKPEVVALLDEAESGIDAYTGLINVLDKIQLSNTGNTQPPAPDVHPPDFNTRDIAVRGRSILPVNAAVPECAREYRSDLTFEYLSGTGINGIQDKANRLAEVWGKISWGRYKAAQITTDLDDAWFGFSPLDRVDFIEDPTAVDGLASYLGDGFGFALSNNRCAIDIDGVFLGFANPATPAIVAPIYQERPQTEPSEGESFVAVSVDRSGLDGALPVITAAVSEGESFEMFVPELVQFESGEGESVEAVDRVGAIDLPEGESAVMTVIPYWEAITAEEWAEMALTTYTRIWY